VKRKEAAIGLYFLTRYAPDSGFFFMLTSEHKRKIQQRVERYPLKNISPGGEGESKRKRKFDEKAAAGWFCKGNISLVPGLFFLMPGGSGLPSPHS
jgi:hypothetical protein